VRVSVIIPAYNAAATIGETLRSVLDQTWRDIEVVVIDDGSTDDTATILAEFKSQSVTILSQENRGASSARNMGLRKAHGDYIQFLDADDLLSPTKIELQLKALEFTTERSVASCAWVHFETNPAHAVYEPQPVWTVQDPLEWLVRSLSGQGMMQPAAWLTPRSVIDAAGNWNESLSLHDDGEFFTRVLLHADRNVFVPDAVVYYRRVGESLSRRRSPNAIASAWEVCKERHHELLKARDDKPARRAIATQYAQFAYEFQQSAPHLAREALAAIRTLDVGPAPTVGGSAFRVLAATLGFERALNLRASLS
jgi:glycosyltransferase involved in cell wall biosynthesis